MTGGQTDSRDSSAKRFGELLGARDFPFSLFKATPWKVGVGIFVALMAVFVGLDLLTARMNAEAHLIFGIHLETYVLALLTTYVLVANEDGRRRFIDDMLVLSPVLKLLLEGQLAVFEGQVRTRNIRRVLTGLVVNFAAFPFLMPVYLRDGYSSWAASSLALQVSLLIFVVGSAFYDAIDMNVRIGRLTAKGFNIDLLEMAPLDSFGRMGLATAAKIIVGSAVAIPLMLDSGATMVTATFVVAMIVLAAFVLVLPSRAAHRAIAQEKKKEISRINEKIRAESQQNTGKYDMAGLISYRNMIEEIREWPLGTPVLIRFVAIGIFPVLSWFAAAFADQIVERVVG